jgi:hypothetical protein
MLLGAGNTAVGGEPIDDAQSRRLHSVQGDAGTLSATVPSTNLDNTSYDAVLKISRALENVAVPRDSSDPSYTAGEIASAQAELLGLISNMHPAHPLAIKIVTVLTCSIKELFADEGSMGRALDARLARTIQGIL